MLGHSHGSAGVDLAYFILGIVLIQGGLAMSEEKMGLEVEWVFNTSAQFTDRSFGAGHQGPPTVWDIDGDGVNEILWGTRRGHSKRLWCIEGDGSFQWIYPPLDQDGLPGDPTSKVSVVDVDVDGEYELALAGRGGRLHVINPDGSGKWTWDEPTGRSIHGAPQACDVDGDGFVEFFLVTNGGHVHRVDHRGELVWTSSQFNRGGLGHPTICDINQDGRHEILWNPYHGNVYCMDSMEGTLIWEFETRANPPLIVADVNHDSRYEVVVWTEAGESAVIVIGEYGAEISRWIHPRFGANMRMCQAMGDVDVDGSMDLAVMSGDAVFVIDIGAQTPTVKWEANFTQWSIDGLLPEGAQNNHWTSYQLIVDIDGDGQQEILWLSPFPIVTDGATGELEAYYVDQYIARDRRQENGGWWGDVDGDGVSEWVVELNGQRHSQTRLFCLTLNGEFPAEAYWPEYYHCAYPAGYQAGQDWLLLKAAYSNSMWFPMGDRFSLLAIPSLILLIITNPFFPTRESGEVSPC